MLKNKLSNFGFYVDPNLVVLIFTKGEVARCYYVVVALSFLFLLCTDHLI